MYACLCRAIRASLVAMVYVIQRVFALVMKPMVGCIVVLQK